MINYFAVLTEKNNVYRVRVKRNRGKDVELDLDDNETVINQMTIPAKTLPRAVKQAQFIFQQLIDAKEKIEKGGELNEIPVEQKELGKTNSQN